MEAMRSLKRRLSDIVYRRTLDDTLMHQRVRLRRARVVQVLDAAHASYLLPGIACLD
jgi:hypothetical protein